MTHDKTDLDQWLTLGNLFFKWNGDFLRLPDHIEYILYNTYNNNHQKTQKNIIIYTSPTSTKLTYGGIN